MHYTWQPVQRPRQRKHAAPLPPATSRTSHTHTPALLLSYTPVHICTYIHVHKISLSRSASQVHTDKTCLSRLESRVLAIYPAAIAVALPTPVS